MEVDKRERFQRLATKRTQKILDQLRLLGNCSNTSNYTYTDDEVKKIFTAIRKELDEQEARFVSDSKKRKRFSL